MNTDGEERMRCSIAICDDEKLWTDCAYDAVMSYQEQRKIVYNIQCFSSAEEYLSQNNTADILLLDIKMESLTGIELKNMLSPKLRSEAIIFMTNYSNYMPEAFGKNVYGFLEKPMNEEKLFELLDQVMENLELEVELGIGENRFISSSDILYIKAIDKYVEVYMNSGMVTGYISLKECEDMLPEKSFMRIHKSYIIHLEYIEKLGTEVKMTDGVNLKVGRGKLKILRERYFHYAKLRAR